MEATFMRKAYRITEKDESGVIPEQVQSAIVDYDEQGKPTSVYFNVEPGQFHGVYVPVGEDVHTTPSLNHLRTQEERERIASHLESSLRDSQ